MDSGEASSRPTQRRVLRDRRDDQRRAEHAGHLLRPHLDDAREREQELPVRQRVLRRVAAHDRSAAGTCSRPASTSAAAAAVRGGHVRARPARQAVVHHRRDALRHARVRERRELAPPRPRRRAARSPPGAPPAPRRSRRACAVVHTPDALTHERPAFSAIDATITSRYCSQSVRRVGAEQDLAVAGTVHLDARVLLPGADRRRRRRTACRARSGARSRPRRACSVG